MVDFVLICSSEIGAHRSVLTGNYDAAAAGGMCGRGEVFGAKTGCVVALAEGLGILVLADAADVDSGFWGEDVLEIVRYVPNW